MSWIFQPEPNTWNAIQEAKFSATAWRENVANTSFWALELTWDLHSLALQTLRRKTSEWKLPWRHQNHSKPNTTLLLKQHSAGRGSLDTAPLQTEERNSPMPFEQETQRAKEANTEEVRAARIATEPIQPKQPKRRQSKQSKQAPPGAMWFVPGQTKTAVKKSKIQDSQNPENVAGNVGSEGTAESSQDVGDVGDVADAKEETIEAPVLDDPWQTLEENRQLAWAFAEESPLEKVDVWDQAPDASFKALAWEELEKVETELSKLKEEDGIGLHEDEDEEAILTAQSQELPIEALRTEILERVRSHRATILVGATGCGKSTQLPRYIMEEPGASVLVTQPRRVAAVEIAKRVAAERGERIGKNVGYRISGEIVEGNGKLQFATIGREWAGYGKYGKGMEMACDVVWACGIQSDCNQYEFHVGFYFLRPDLTLTCCLLNLQGASCIGLKWSSAECVSFEHF